MVFQPRFDAVRVEGVPTREEHGFLSHFKVYNANRASRVFNVSVVQLFAVLRLNRDLRQPLHVVLVSWAAVGLLLLLTHLLGKRGHKLIEIQASPEVGALA